MTEIYVEKTMKIRILIDAGMSVQAAKGGSNVTGE